MFKRNLKPILGFRRWDFTEDYLKAAVHPYIWKKGENIAECETCAALGEECPNWICHCGFNAWFNLERAIRSYDYSDTVVGSIAAAGNFQIHKQGFRSEKAQIIALYIDPEIKQPEDDPSWELVNLIMEMRGLEPNRKKMVKSMEDFRKEYRETVYKVAQVYAVPVFEDEVDFVDFSNTYARTLSKREIKKISGQTN